MNDGIRNAWGLLLAATLVLGGCPTEPTGDDDTDVGDDDSADDDDTDATWLAVDAGVNNSCGLRSDGVVQCWGLADTGITAPPAGGFTQVSSGLDHACAVAGDGSLQCWGCYDEPGIPACNAPTGTYTRIGTGDRHSCALAADGAIHCWGDDSAGATTPPAGTFTDVTAGDGYGCALAGDGAIHCWGDESPLEAEENPLAGNWVQLAGGQEDLCALHASGEVECWAAGYSSFLGSWPDEFFTGVAVGYWHACAVRPDATVSCWGYADLGATTPPEGDFLEVSAGAWHSCGVTVAGALECWGGDAYGEASFGQGTTVEYEVPAASGGTCTEVEPNDVPATELIPPFDVATDCDGMIGAGGLADRLEGTLSTVVPQTWEGDTDTFRVVVPEEGYVTGSLDWSSSYHDLDWYLWCYYGDDFNPYGWYYVTDSADSAGLDRPADARSVIPMPAGTECFAWIVGYDAPDETAYTLDLWMQAE